MSDDDLPVSTHKKDVAEFRLKLLKDEIASQGNAFDQMDVKTGVALGFTFVVVGQVLAAVFRMATDQNRFQTLHPTIASWVFGFAEVSVLLAIICGAAARWPRSFDHSVSWEAEDLSGSYEEMLESAIPEFETITTGNDKTLTKKSRWAKLTYLFVGLALFAYLVLTAFLYWFAIPRH